jgi:ferredoxin, 2Fe-2S
MQVIPVIVIDEEGTHHTLEALVGWRLMEVIRDYGLPMKAECGGACACATCHVYVDHAWLGRIHAASEEEIERLDDAFTVKENSRLSCQIILQEDYAGLVVTLAPMV